MGTDQKIRKAASELNFLFKNPKGIGIDLQ